MFDIKAKTLIDRRELLKIKLASLVAEGQIIREQERRQLRFSRRICLPQAWLYEDMRNHRVLVVRKQARLTGLALGLIRGRTLRELEPTVVNRLTARDLDAIRKMVYSYGSEAACQLYNEQADQYREEECAPA